MTHLHLHTYHMHICMYLHTVVMYNLLMYIYILLWLQETPLIEDGQEDKSEKRISQEKHTPTAGSEYEDTKTERKVSVRNKWFESSNIMFRNSILLILCIYTYVHAYVHTYICMHVHTYIYPYIHTYIRMYVRTYIHT